MSFAPITRWTPRCDGDTTRGQCPELLAYNAHPDAADCYAPTDKPGHDSGGDPRAAEAAAAEDAENVEWREVLLDAPALDAITVGELRAAGWHVARDGRLLCRRHVAALEYLARAEIDGLPFPTTHPAHIELAGTEEES